MSIVVLAGTDAFLRSAIDGGVCMNAAVASATATTASADGGGSVCFSRVFSHRIYAMCCKIIRCAGTPRKKWRARRSVFPLPT